MLSKNCNHYQWPHLSDTLFGMRKVILSSGMFFSLLTTEEARMTILD